VLIRVTFSCIVVYQVHSSVVFKSKVQRGRGHGLKPWGQKVPEIPPPPIKAGFG
jgi:hypothetical protein